MTARNVLASFIFLFVFVQVGFAGTQHRLQNYFNKVAIQVKATENPIEKRDIINKKLQNMSRAADVILGTQFISKSDREGILKLKTILQARQDELAGRNGYVKVQDNNLNAFSDYIVQDMEQADQTVTISLVTLLIIIIVVILLVR